MSRRSHEQARASRQTAREIPWQRQMDLPRRPPALRVLIVRHGQTWHNVNGVIQGQLDTDLDGHGRKQAEVLGKYLANEKIDEIYSSPLRRASDTATAIWYAQPFPKPAMYVDNRLKERALGELEGVLPERTPPEADQPAEQSSAQAESSQAANAKQTADKQSASKHATADSSSVPKGGKQPVSSDKNGSTGTSQTADSPEKGTSSRQSKTGSNVKPSTRQSRQRRDGIRGAERAVDLDSRMASFWNDLVANSVEDWSPDAFNALPRRIDEELYPGIAHKSKDPANWAKNGKTLPSAAMRLNAEFGTYYKDAHIPTVLIAGHGACLSSLLDVIYPYAVGDRHRNRMHNCSVTEVYVWEHPEQFQRLQKNGRWYSPGHQVNMGRWPVKPHHLLEQQVQVPVWSAEEERSAPTNSKRTSPRNNLFVTRRFLHPEPESHILVTLMADTSHLECLYAPEPGTRGAEPSTADNADQIVLEGDKRA